MIDEPQADSAGAQVQAAGKLFFEHVTEILQNTLNARWDEADYHVAAMDELVKRPDVAALPNVDALYIPIKEFAFGFHQLATGQTDDDRKSALAHLNLAKEALRKTKTEQPEVAKNPGFRQMVQGIELNILVAQQQIARERGDQDEVARLSQQSELLLDDMRATLDPQDPMYGYHQAMKLYRQAMPSFSRGMQCLVEMNLDLAQDYLGESSKAFDKMRSVFANTKADTLVIQAGKNVAEGFGLLVIAQEIYVRVMRAAIIGDVNKSDVQALEKAERSFVDGAALISDAAHVMPGAFGKMDIVATSQTQARLIRNLRTLCERSLSPKAITVSTTPKVFFYFVGTFLVLLIGLPVSGLVTRLQSTDLGVLLIVSLVVSVIGAFGFEAMRFVPLFDAFSRWLPWAGQKGAKPEQS